MYHGLSSDVLLTLKGAMQYIWLRIYSANFSLIYTFIIYTYGDVRYILYYGRFMIYSIIRIWLRYTKIV